MLYIIYLYEYDEIYTKTDILMIIYALKEFEIDLLIITDIKKINWFHEVKMKKHFTDSNGDVKEAEIELYTTTFNNAIEGTVKLENMTVTVNNKFEITDLLSIRSIMEGKRCIIHFAGHTTPKNNYVFNLWNNDDDGYFKYEQHVSEFNKYYNQKDLIMINDCCYSKTPNYSITYKWLNKKAHIFPHNDEIEYIRIMLNVSQDMIHKSKKYLTTCRNLKTIIKSLIGIIEYKSKRSVDDALDILAKIYVSQNTYLHIL